MKKDKSEAKKAKAEAKKAKLSAKLEAKSAKLEAKKAKNASKTEAKKVKNAAKAETKKAKAEAKKAKIEAKKANAASKKSAKASKKPKSDDKKVKFNINKKVLIPIILIVFLASASIGYLIATREPASKPVVAEEYSIGGSSVASISSFLGKEIKLKQIIEPEGDSQEIKYVYKKSAIKPEEATQYGDYLSGELNYVPMNSKDGDPLIYIIETEDETKLFKIKMETVEKDYVITASVETGEVPRPEEKKKEVTRDDAYSKLSEFMSAKTDELPEPLESYDEIFDIGQAFIGDDLCYGVNVYRKSESDTNEIVAKYYVSLENNNIYEYDLQTGEYRLVNEKK
ncbi:MAG: hypothetical protein HFE62_05585 [Firmicutes bacterium]|nr:hypothetical protein [Bacillota bacterium]